MRLARGRAGVGATLAGVGAPLGRDEDDVPSAFRVGLQLLPRAGERPSPGVGGGALVSVPAVGLGACCGSGVGVGLGCSGVVVGGLVDGLHNRHDLLWVGVDLSDADGHEGLGLRVVDLLE